MMSLFHLQRKKNVFEDTSDESEQRRYVHWTVHLSNVGDAALKCTYYEY